MSRREERYGCYLFSGPKSGVLRSQPTKSTLCEILHGSCRDTLLVPAVIATRVVKMSKKHSFRELVNRRSTSLVGRSDHVGVIEEPNFCGDGNRRLPIQYIASRCSPSQYIGVTTRNNVQVFTLKFYPLQRLAIY